MRYEQAGDGLAVKIYSKDKYNIYLADNSYIVHNTRKEFEAGHTHINSLDTAKYIIDLAIHRSMPHHLSTYLLASLIRISNDGGYSSKVEELIQNKKHKQPYRNRSM